MMKMNKKQLLPNRIGFCTPSSCVTFLLILPFDLITPSSSMYKLRSLTKSGMFLLPGEFKKEISFGEHSACIGLTRYVMAL